MIRVGPQYSQHYGLTPLQGLLQMQPAIFLPAGVASGGFGWLCDSLQLHTSSVGVAYIPVHRSHQLLCILNLPMLDHLWQRCPGSRHALAIVQHV